jgi:Tol biopolymer transport system component
VQLKRTTERGLGAAAAALVLGAAVAAAAGITRVERVSVSTEGAAANSYSLFPSISGDGRYVAFLTDASNLVPGDTNGKQDILLRDRATGTTELVSVSASGQAADGYSSNPTVSADGQYVVFVSQARNLVAGEANPPFGDQIFLRDRTMGTTERISVSSTGVAGNRNCERPSISADGRFVAFESAADNLVPGDTNKSSDVFVRDRVSGTTERVSVSTTGAQGSGTEQSAAGVNASISPDGRYVAFASRSDNLVPGDTNRAMDVFVRDRTAGTTERVSISSTGAEGNGSSYDTAISEGGRCVAFTTEATNLAAGQVPVDPCYCHTEVLLRDRTTGTTERVILSADGNPADHTGIWPSISADGRYVTFESADALVTGDTNEAVDVFVRDRVTQTTQQVSVSAAGQGGNGESVWPSISADGRCVAFTSKATNLLPGAPGVRTDVYVVERSPGSP